MDLIEMSRVIVFYLTLALVLASPIAGILLIIRDTWRSNLSQARRQLTCALLGEAAMLVIVYDLAIILAMRGRA
jgi:UPF0716 family protein affecting phage T7 exclusion